MELDFSHSHLCSLKYLSFGCDLYFPYFRYRKFWGSLESNVTLSLEQFSSWIWSLLDVRMIGDLLYMDSHLVLSSLHHLPHSCPGSYLLLATVALASWVMFWPHRHGYIASTIVSVICIVTFVYWYMRVYLKWYVALKVVSFWLDLKPNWLDSRVTNLPLQGKEWGRNIMSKFDFKLEI